MINSRINEQYHDILKLYPSLALRPDASIRDAMNAMTKSRVGIVVVVGPGRRLLGVVGDLDFRRALLHDVQLDSPVTAALNRKPLTMPVDATREEIAAAFAKHRKTHLPLVDKGGRLCALVELHDFAKIARQYPNRVIVMAGGAGKRLRPLTENTPKPMLRLADKPILEHLVEQMATAGFSRFTFTVNYLAEQIRRHFGDGERWKVEIDYVHERKPLGTAGSLGLLRNPGDKPLIVLNGDILTNVDFPALLQFHDAEKGLATICVKRHEIQVPYGVVEQSRRYLTRFVEKPTQRFLVNAGIYVIDPRALPWLPRRRPCDMPEFLDLIRARRRGGVACFPIQEYWLDIGGHQEFDRASKDIRGLFE
ncbi:MAG TPA: nucleotidyltransferase family protein [Elusimicrobiota bacterium]|jgi:dTDP-glucose pyrophosphorylase|nr:nucleotidyltransferase family protein [Elusimicrobiota bacterium]